MAKKRPKYKLLLAKEVLKMKRVQKYLIGSVSLNLAFVGGVLMGYLN